MASRRSPGIVLSVLLLFGVLPGLHAQGDVTASRDIQSIQQWLAGQPEYRVAMDNLYNILASTIGDAPPRGQTAATFQRLAADLSSTQAVLQDTMAGLPAWDGGANPARVLTALHHRFYTAGSACEPGALALPDSLDAAAAQVETAAAAMVAAFQQALATEQADFLRSNHGLMMQLLQEYPFGGAFTEATMATLVRYIDILHAAGLSPLFCAWGGWSRFLDSAWQDNLRGLMQTHPAAGEDIIRQYFTPYGRIVFGGAGDMNLLSGNLLFIADAGGDDIYALRTQDAWSGLPQLIMDFAGNDTYDALEPGGYAAGIGSIALLADYAGNDTYHAHSQTQGFGLFGIGILYDGAGDDEYIAGTMAQGFALFGAGLLLDAAGDDRYQIRGMGQGAGMTDGVGVLVDLGGADQYLATGVVPTSYGTPGLSDSWSQGIGVGVRYVTPGGVGILDDRGGSDTYTAGSFSQGGGYFLGAGFFHDAGDGNDRYLGSRYNFGWGAHMGVGYFREDGGDDHYRTRQIVSAGLAWDLSVVMFEDRAGDDVYEMGDFSLGASAHRSISLFRDHDGSDIYRNVLPGRADQGPPNLSLFLDTGSGENSFEPGIGDTPCARNGALGFVLVTAGAPAAGTLDCAPE